MNAEKEAIATRIDYDLAGYVRDARSTANPCCHWIGGPLAVCSPCLRDRLLPHFAIAFGLRFPPGDPGEVSERCDPTHVHGARCSQDEIGDWWHTIPPAKPSSESPC